MSSTFVHQFDSSLYKGSVAVPTGLFINGQFVEAINKEYIDVINPVDGTVLTKVSGGNSKDVDLAVDAARKAFKTSWGLKVPAVQRGRLLQKLADLLEKHNDELAAIEALDCGMHYGSTSTFEVKMAVDVIRYYAGWADKNHGQTMETNTATFAYTRHEPIGVCALVVPWNFPLVLGIFKIAPALATGNTIVVKPSEVTPLSTLLLARLVNEAGFPPGVVNVVVGYGQTAGQALAEHPKVDKISFTGSGLVGRKIMEAAAKSNLKRVTLELGGKSPVIVFDDADLDQAIKCASIGIFYHSGQICAAGSRIFVQEGVYDKFVQGITTIAQAAKHGDGFDPDNTAGPLVSEAQLKRVLSYIESGKSEGATVITGGNRVGNKGYFVQPTVFADVKHDMKIVKEEIFGPVCTIVKFKTEEEAIELANDTVYGLSSCIYTENLARAIRVSNAMESGQACVNTFSSGGIQVPFGGFKQSGFGKELGQYALEVFTNVKAVHINIGNKI